MAQPAIERWVVDHIGMQVLLVSMSQFEGTIVSLGHKRGYVSSEFNIHFL